MRLQVQFKMITDGALNLDFEGYGNLEQNILTFSDFEGSTYQVYLNEERVLLHRIGEIPLKMSFQKNQISKAFLQTEEREFEFSLKTTKYIFRGSHLEISYDIIDKTQVLSSHHLTLDWAI